MRLVRVGTRYINLDSLAYARIVLDPDGNREMILRFRASTGTEKNTGLASLRLEGKEATDLEKLLDTLCEYSQPTEPLNLGPMASATNWQNF